MSLILPLSLLAQVPASVDRTQVGAQQTFHLYIDVANVKSADNIDLSVLDGSFQIYGRSRQSSTSIINGNVTRKREIVLTLLPLSSGILTIPAITVGNDKTAPIQITVLSSSNLPKSLNNDEIILKAEVNQKSSFVQQEILYTLKVYVGTQLSRASLTPPKLIKGDAVFEQIGKEKNYQQTIKGKRYVVYEYQYSIIPQKSGQVVISPALFQAVKQNSAYGSSIDSLFDDMFTIPSLGQRGKSLQLASKKILIDVKPIPSTFRGKDWLPAQSLTLFDEWNKSQGPYPAGEPVTRSITLTAEGMTTNQLPELQIEDVPGVKQYATPGVKNEEIIDGVKISSLTTQVTVIPNTQGKVTLPAIKIPWWNTKTNKAEIAKLKAVTIEVKGGTELNNAPITGSNLVKTPQKSSTGQTADNKSKSSIQSSINDKNSFINKLTDNLASNYYWYLLVLIILGMVSYLLLKVRKNNRSMDVLTDKSQFSQTDHSVNRRQKEKLLLKQVIQSCKDNDALASRNNLLALARNHWPKQKKITLNYLIEKTNDALAEEIEILNGALYKTDNSFWQGEQLAETIIEYFSNTNFEQKKSNQLEPLFKS